MPIAATSTRSGASAIRDARWPPLLTTGAPSKGGRGGRRLAVVVPVRVLAPCDCSVEREQRCDHQDAVRRRLPVPRVGAAAQLGADQRTHQRISRRSNQSTVPCSGSGWLGAERIQQSPVVMLGRRHAQRGRTPRTVSSGTWPAALCVAPNSSGQGTAALAAPRGHDRSARPSPHAQAKAMDPGPPTVVRLVCPLALGHGVLSSSRLAA